MFGKLLTIKHITGLINIKHLSIADNFKGNAHVAYPMCLVMIYKTQGVGLWLMILAIQMFVPLREICEIN